METEAYTRAYSLLLFIIQGRRGTRRACTTRLTFLFCFPPLVVVVVVVVADVMSLEIHGRERHSGPNLGKYFQGIN